MEKKLNLVYLAPAISKQANDFLSALGLGIDGAYCLHSESITITFKKNMTLEQINEKLPNVILAIENCLLREGCKDINIWSEGQKVK